MLGAGCAEERKGGVKDSAWLEQPGVPSERVAQVWLLGALRRSRLCHGAPYCKTAMRHDFCYQSCF